MLILAQVDEIDERKDSRCSKTGPWILAAKTDLLPGLCALLSICRCLLFGRYFKFEEDTQNCLMHVAFLVVQFHELSLEILVPFEFKLGQGKD